ncbi:hypothetical protein LOB55_03770 [Lactobacillus delbrueckii subsp. lactis]|uniref:Uncharacterized protein n=1 Tax=Lactobacillus delbrueckii subsp. lactis TaxID=29397 RepID=A0A3G6K688_LACDL|nr:MULTISPECIES: hypothetical protein [Lactobacillales]YP_007003026.1 hypothetical protein F367_gp63 [Lactobacillus phage JCL1032]ACB72603.1 hypothetical protein [Lactobacillus phage JCL1032]AZA15965.1 MAG: hypothetical protein DQL93_04945 [Lactobacillus delbrueckii subsp. lactis]AZA25463.1 MAG: hypothetical protein DF199_06685 [Lactobacillus delbrueckii subsp. lactis]MBO3081435.1 hypothetical protein [Lactobacillus delbrueckii subsp. bulgaricus]MCD5438064.1 hypothetical protein [Lactobacillu
MKTNNFSLRSFPDGTQTTISDNEIMLYGADGKEWARIIRTDTELIPFPTDDIPNDCKEILKNVCKSAMKGI